MTDLDEEQLMKLASKLAPLLETDRRREKPEGANAWITGIVGTLAIISIIFSVGVSWSRLSENERAITALVLKVDSLDRTVTTQATTGAVVQSQLEQIQRDVTDIKAQVFQRQRP